MFAFFIVTIYISCFRDNEGAKIDDSSKSGRDSSEVELDSLGDNTKIDQFSEGKYSLYLYKTLNICMHQSLCDRVALCADSNIFY